MPVDSLEDYVLGSDRTTMDRYELFNAVNHPITVAGFQRLEVKPDAYILEIGCGIGHTACWMAKEIVPQGQVTAFDVSQDLIDLAKERAERMDLENIAFHTKSAADFDYGSARYDLIHTRYVLCYLQGAGEIVQKAAAALVPGGAFFGEEVVASFVAVSGPTWPQTLCRWFFSLIEKTGGHPNYGIEGLPSDLFQAGLERLEVGAFAPMKDPQMTAAMLRSALVREMQESLVSAGVATREEVDALVAASEEDDPSAIFSPAMVGMCIAYKPE